MNDWMERLGLIVRFILILAIIGVTIVTCQFIRKIDKVDQSVSNANEVLDKTDRILDKAEEKVVKGVDWLEKKYHTR